MRIASIEEGYARVLCSSAEALRRSERAVGGAGDCGARTSQQPSGLDMQLNAALLGFQLILATAFAETIAVLSSIGVRESLSRLSAYPGEPWRMKAGQLTSLGVAVSVAKAASAEILSSVQRAAGLKRWLLRPALQ